jgi:hypothetical protein
MLSRTRVTTWRPVAPELEDLAGIPSTPGVTSLSFPTILIHWRRVPGLRDIVNAHPTVFGSLHHTLFDLVLMLRG